MKIAVIGAGAIGSMFGAYLAESGKDVSFVVREGIRANVLKENGLTVSGVKGEITVTPKIFFDASLAGIQDLVLVCVKAYQTKEAVLQHKALVGENTVVLSMQNGIGNVEQIAEVVGEEKVMAGSTTNGGYITEDGVLHHVGDGTTQIGELNGEQSERLKEIVGLFDNTKIKVSIAENILKVLYTKLAINCAINPLTALLKVQNGDVFELENLKEVARNAVLEVADLALVKGIEFDREKLVEQMFEVARVTRKNYSSMYKDVVQGRETEIEAICGAVKRFGFQSGVNTPVNSCLYSLVAATTLSAKKKASGKQE